MESSNRRPAEIERAGRGPADAEVAERGSGAARGRSRRRGLIVGGIVAVLVLAVAGGIAAVLFLGGDASAPTRGQWFFGNSLAVNLQQLSRVPEVRYSEGDKQWVIRPKNDGNELAAARLIVRNTQSSVAIMTINEKSLRISDSKYVDYDVVDPFTQREELPPSTGPTGARSPLLDRYVPFIWGGVELPQQCFNQANSTMEGCMLDGWVLFEIPKGEKLTQVVWETSDVVYLRFDQ